MSLIKKLEVIFAKWNQSVPHLPERTKWWLADNGWWLAIVAVLLTVTALFASIPQLLTSIALSSAFNLLTPSVYYYENPVALTWVMTTLIMAGFFINATIVSMAIGLLKDKEKQGWDVIFWAYLVGTFCFTAGGVTTLNTVILSFALVEAVIGGYLLFEVRECFMQGQAARVVAKATVAHSDKTHRR